MEVQSVPGRSPLSLCPSHPQNRYRISSLCQALEFIGSPSSWGAFMVEVGTCEIQMDRYEIFKGVEQSEQNTSGVGFEGSGSRACVLWWDGGSFSCGG